MLHGLHFPVTEVGELATLVASFHRALAKGDGETPKPRNRGTKGSHRLLASLNRVSIMVSSRRVSRGKHITRTTQGKRMVGSRVRRGNGEGCVGLRTHFEDYATPRASRARFDQPNTMRAQDTHTNQAVQLTQDRVSVQNFRTLVFHSVEVSKIKMNDIGFNVGLQR